MYSRHNISDVQLYYMYLAMGMKCFVQHLQNFQLLQKIYFQYLGDIIHLACSTVSKYFVVVNYNDS